MDTELVKKALVGYLRQRGKSEAQAESLATANLAAATTYLQSRVTGFTPATPAEAERAKRDESWILAKAYADLRTWSTSL